MSETEGSDPIEAIIVKLVAAAPEGRSVSPADVAKAIDPERFNRQFGHVRQAAIRLARRGEVTILRKGKPVEDPENFKGVWRIGRA
ncbi:MAG: hypothetical protein CMH94_06070 [Oceanicaulis sp.]|jgi:hypothetical protein|uniref:DUF3253 domain-containing protein n=1 Tax=Maricaulis virginensis TaxID=144022 RepID=A0A9W6IK38_9PROT|nr:MULTISPECIES: DUF3253 domain-containing protein [Maricaulis]MBI75152.1 hypothetical protein [Oceanicaulis sp.]MBO6765809.1 DUF3253 domain-containing protein [Maricaulis sp.]GLK50739.1 hypothetical protein GCM10017621_02470 [Maricaulis virginensis]